MQIKGPLEQWIPGYTNSYSITTKGTVYKHYPFHKHEISSSKRVTLNKKNFTLPYLLAKTFLPSFTEDKVVVVADKTKPITVDNLALKQKPTQEQRCRSIYRQMIRRCTEENNIQYKNYGGRGITVCARWKESFENFKKDMGIPPKDTSLDRIDNNGNYEPSNCKWSTPKEQALNRRTNHLLTYNDKTQTLQEWADELGISPITLRKRLEYGWSTKKALFYKIQRHDRTRKSLSKEVREKLGVRKK